MPRIEIAAGAIAYEEVGDGPPLLCLHGGWGRGAMPFDEAVRQLSARYRLILPDRMGYGRSTPIDRLSRDYHLVEAGRLTELLDRLEIERPILWGHSDGAIIAALFAALHPARPAAAILEAIHFHRAKSRRSFESWAAAPEALPPPVRERLAADHGPRWPQVIRMHAKVWLEFHEMGGDFYGELLGEVRCPVLVLHGEADPHTPVAEVEEVARRIRGAELALVPKGGHSPHSEPAMAESSASQVGVFLERRGL